MKNTILVRIFDFAVLALLLVSHESANSFAAILAAFMAIVMLIGFFAMSTELANKVKAKGVLSKAFGMVVQATYVGALIYAGFPSIAAFYAISAALLRASVRHKLKPQEAH